MAYSNRHARHASGDDGIGHSLLGLLMMGLGGVLAMWVASAIGLDVPAPSGLLARSGLFTAPAEQQVAGASIMRAPAAVQDGPITFAAAAPTAAPAVVPTAQPAQAAATSAAAPASATAAAAPTAQLTAALAPLNLDWLSSYCLPGQPLGFVLGFADLQKGVGAPMGYPLECEHPANADGVTIQRTNTGVAAYDPRANATWFTDGHTRWTLAAGAVAQAPLDASDPFAVVAQNAQQQAAAWKLSPTLGATQAAQSVTAIRAALAAATPAPASATPAASATTTALGGQQMKVVNTDGSGVVIRSRPEDQARIPDGFLEGELVTALGQSGQYIHVQGSRGRYGWVPAQYLAPAAAQGAAPTAAPTGQPQPSPTAQG